MSRTLELSSFKLESGNTGISTYKETEVIDGVAHLTEHPDVRSPKTIVHDDLLTAFEALKPHLAVLTEYADSHKAWAKASEAFRASFRVTGFILKSKNESDGVQLIGRKTLRSGKVINLLTQFVKFDPEQEHDYTDHCEELEDLVSACHAESYNYVTKAKVGVNPQTELDLEKDADENGEVLSGGKEVHLHAKTA